MKKLHQKSAQTAIEYLILLSLVAVIVMFSFSHLFPRANQAVSSLFLTAGASIMGETVQSIDGNWCEWSACDCDEFEDDPIAKAACLAALIDPLTGQRVRHRLCDCPAPLGSGTLCAGSSTKSCSSGGGGGGGDDGGGDSGDGSDD